LSHSVCPLAKIVEGVIAVPTIAAREAHMDDNMVANCDSLIAGIRTEPDDATC
jgi:hypothetical protein